MKPGKISPILFVVLGVSIGLFGFFLILANPFSWKFSLFNIFNLSQKTDNGLPEGVVIAPTPYLLLPSGKQTYNARGSNTRSSVVSITFDPLDPALNTNQTISATVNSKETINSVTLTVNTDKKSNSQPMKLISGSATRGVWTSTFQVIDSYEKIYNVSFEIITELGNKTVQPMPIR